MRYRRPSFGHSTRSSCSTRSESSNTVLQYMSVQVSVGIGTKIGTDRHPVFPTVGRRPKLGSIVRFPPEFPGRSQLNVPHFRGALPCPLFFRNIQIHCIIFSFLSLHACGEVCRWSKTPALLRVAFPYGFHCHVILLLCVGFFHLKGSRGHDRHQADSTRADGKPGATYHLFYESDVLCGKARKHCSTIPWRFIIAKCHVPASLCVGPVLLEASEITPIHH